MLERFTGMLLLYNQILPLYAGNVNHVLVLSQAGAINNSGKSRLSDGCMLEWLLLLVGQISFSDQSTNKKDLLINHQSSRQMSPEKDSKVNC